VKIALRDYRPSDFEDLYEIDQACYSNETAYSRAELRTYLGFFGADCVVAEMRPDSAETASRGRGEDKERIGGFCISVRRGDHGHIITIDVLAEFRRSGVGSALLAEIESRLAASGVQRVGLETATDNQAGIAFWQTHGYVSVGVKKGYYAGKRDAYYMTKEIGATKEARAAAGSEQSGRADRGGADAPSLKPVKRTRKR
jgi:ribosomal protein S18 acetylase RimI-like enzyme